MLFLTHKFSKECKIIVYNVTVPKKNGIVYHLKEK